MNAFQLLSDIEQLFFAPSQEAFDCDVQLDYSTCPTCLTHMSVRNNRYMCERCGHSNESVEVSDHMSMASDNNYNALSSGIRCVGNNAHRYQSILRANSNSSESNSEALLNQVLFGFHQGSKNVDIPKEVRLAVADQYRHIRTSGVIARGTIFKAMLASLTYYECLSQRFSYKPADIYNYYGIDPSTYSKGDKKIRELLDYGQLDIDIRNINTEESFICTYASSLDLPEAHMKMLIDLLQFVIARKIINPNAKSSTRALAVLSFFITATKYNMNSAAFEKHFKCNFGSVRTLSLDMIQKFELIRPIFQQHSIECDGIKLQTKRISKRKVKKGSRIAVPNDQA